MIRCKFNFQLKNIVLSVLELQMIKDMQSAPTEIDLMQDTIGVLANSSAPPEEVLLALEALQSLVEPIDNANGQPSEAYCDLVLHMLMSLLISM